MSFSNEEKIMKLYLRIVFVLLIGVFLSGCALIQGKPTSPVDVEKITERISSNLEKIDDAQIDTIKERNEAMNQVLIVIDLRYEQFINNAGLQQRSLDMATDFVQLSLNLAGTAVGGSGLKTLLAALSAGISGTEIGFDKSFLYEKTLSALRMQMDADRAKKRLEITQSMNKHIEGIDGYSWSMAVRDLIKYYDVGTLQNAISSIKENAGYKKRIAEDEILVIKKLVTSSDVATKAGLTRSLNKIDAIADESAMGKIKAIFRPISEKLGHLPNCKKLDPISFSTNVEIKSALQECIRDVGNISNSPMGAPEELAFLELKFREVNLLN